MFWNGKFSDVLNSTRIVRQMYGESIKNERMRKKKEIIENVVDSFLAEFEPATQALFICRPSPSLPPPPPKIQRVRNFMDFLYPTIAAQTHTYTRTPIHKQIYEYPLDFFHGIACRSRLTLYVQLFRNFVD